MLVWFSLLLLVTYISPATRPDSSAMKFGFDFELLKSQITNITFDDINYVAAQSSSYLSNFIFTYSNTFNIPTGQTCGGQAVASNVSANYEDIDILILVTATDLGNYINATGTVCKYDSYINRPVLGLLTLNSRL